MTAVLVAGLLGFVTFCSDPSPALDGDPDTTVSIRPLPTPSPLDRLGIRNEIEG